MEILAEISVQTVNVHYALYDSVKPVHLSINISLLNQIMHHPDLKKHLEQLKKDGLEVMLTIHHSIKQIEKILKLVSKESAFSHWWEVLFDWSVHKSKVWNILLHPVVVVPLIQFVIIVS